ncbi:MAG TPA: Ig-like domain-containing protein [Candidatus Limnocylindrales bacterium]
MAAALVLLAGGAVAFASQSLKSGSGPDVATATAPPPPAPALLAPSTTITRADSADLTVIAPANLRGDQHYVVRVYVNGNQVSHENLPAEQQFTLNNVPLTEGNNAIRASLVGDGGESPLSAPVNMTRDDQAPVIQVLMPADKVYTDSTMLTGKTEAGATIVITDDAGHDLDATVTADGRFTADLSLTMGNNPLVLKSTDLAGNTATSRATIVRAPSSAAIELLVTPTTIYSSQLPINVQLTTTVRDELGQPVDGVTVVFGVSPPNRETMTYEVVSTNGRARYSDLNLDSGDATGPWLVTALAVLPSGIELRADGSFNLQPGAPKTGGQH